MIVGHFAVAYAARARWQRAALLPLLVATIVPDLADFALPQGDKCRTSCELYTHAMPAVFVLAIAAAFLTWEIYHRRVTSYLVAALVVVHVAMDLVTGSKPYWPGGPNLGMHLYNRPLADFALEASLVVLAWITLRRTKDAPRAAVHPAALLVLLTLQAGMDIWFSR